MRTLAVSTNDVVRAALRIRKFIKHTPTIFTKDGNVALKLECLQHTGAYKVRGALNALSIQVEKRDFRPVIAASAGNHSAGVAWAASRLGLQAVAVVPKTAPQSKKDRTRSLGAQVIVHGDCFDEAFSFAQDLASKKAYRFLHAFDDPDVIAGQGTIAFELLPALPDTVIVPVGGGGLISGISRVLHEHGIKVIGAQISGVDAMQRQLKGSIEGFEPHTTVADGIRVKKPGNLTQQLCKAFVDQFINVTETEVVDAISVLHHHEGIRAEGAGAVAFAAARKINQPNTLVIISGQNIDRPVFDKIIRRRPRGISISHRLQTSFFGNHRENHSRLKRTIT